MITKEQIIENAFMIATILNTAEMVIEENQSKWEQDMSKVIAYEHIMRKLERSVE